jgi:hypothetical protein
MVERNLVLAGTVNSSDADFIAAIQDLEGFQAAWPGALERMITDRGPVEEFRSRALTRRGIKEIIEVAASR